MNSEHISRIYPTNVEFAYRMFSCLLSVIGTLSEREFLDLFSIPDRKWVLSKFRRAVFRGYVKMNIGPPGFTRLEKVSFGVKRKYLRKVRKSMCHHSWRTPYGLYREVIGRGFDREAFDYWWNSLGLGQKVAFLDACAEKIEQSSYSLYLSSLSENAKICVQMAGGPESGGIQEF